MLTLDSFSGSNKSRKRVGRGPSSGHGKTSTRGYNGEKSRSGYKQRLGKEGGQFPLYRKLPCRGFSNARFSKRFDVITLSQIDYFFNDGEIVNIDSLYEKGFLKGFSYGFKVLSNGELNKKVIIKADSISEGAVKKLESAGIEFSIGE